MGWDAGGPRAPLRVGVHAVHFDGLHVLESPLGLFRWYSFVWCCLIHSMVQFFGPLNWFYGKQLDSTPPKVTVSCSDHQQLGLVVQSQDPDSPETTAPFGSFLTIGVHCQV